MKITSDWHIHSRNSCDGAALPVAELIRGAKEKRILDFGLTDHIHTPFNLPDLEASHAEYLASDPGPNFHFGVEASVVSQWELDEIAKGGCANPVYGIRRGGPLNAPLAIGLTAADIARFGIEYVVGGVHWPMYVPFERDTIIRDYHRQNMFLATHPLITVVAHPWWWMGHWRDADGMYRSDPWLDDFSRIPGSMHQEFAAALREHRKIAEINTGAMLCNGEYPETFRSQYAEYLAGLQAEGVTLCIGSDEHEPIYDRNNEFDRAAVMLERAGIADSVLWRLPARNSEAQIEEGYPNVSGS